MNIILVSGKLARARTITLSLPHLVCGAGVSLLGLLILVRWPVSSLYILGVFLGIDLVMAGAGWIGIGFGLRRSR